MAIVLTDDKHYCDIADAIRNNHELMGQIFPSEMADAINQACNKQYEKGKQAEYDRFWDSCQYNREEYMQAFLRWTDGMFYTKYDLPPKGSVVQMFAYCTVTNIKQRLLDCGVKLDLSKATPTNSVFSGARSIALPEINVSSSTNINYLFESCAKCVTIDKLILPNGGNYTALGCFNGASALSNIIIEGTISTSIDIHWSPLGKTSIESIFNALSLDTTGIAITLSKTAVNTAFGINVDDETTYPEGSEYYNLRHSKDNWTINYI